MTRAWRGCQSGRCRVLDHLFTFAETCVTAHDAWRSVRVDGADTPTHDHSGADLGSRDQPSLHRHRRRCSDRWPGLPAELSSTGVLQGRTGHRRGYASTGPGATVRCSGTLAPVCVFQVVMLIASDGGGLNCVNGAAQARNWLVQVWVPRAFCGGGPGRASGHISGATGRIGVF